MRLSLVVGCAALLLAVSPTALAQLDWNVSAQSRYRGEVDDKSFADRADPSTFNLLRTRLGLSLHHANGVILFAQLQDSRVMGEETSTLDDGQADRLDLHQAYVLVPRLFGSPFDVQLGRMEAAYGSERLIGAVGWSNVGRSFDGVRFRTAAERGSLDLFAFQEVERLAPADNGDLYVMGGYGVLKSTPVGQVEPFLIWQRSNPGDQLSRVTIGLRTLTTVSDFEIELEGAYQAGTDADRDISAYLAAGTIRYAPGDGSRLQRIAVGVDAVSGACGCEPNEVKAFNTLYATNHKFYGAMDYFVNLPVHTLGLGLLDAHAGLAARLGQKTGLSVDVHRFWGMDEYTVPGGKSGRLFGDEVDVAVSHRYNETVSIGAGASVFAPGFVFESTKGSNTASWLYLMTTVTL